MHETPSRQPPPASTAPDPPLPASLADASLPLPRLIVFDLDYTLWPFWVSTHVTPPLEPAPSPATASDCLGTPLAFYPDVPSVLHALSRAASPRGPVQLAVASRTETPHLARLLLRALHLPPAPGTDAPRRAVDVFAAGLEMYPGSKLRHFEALHARTAVPFEDMLFFDDESRNRETETLGVTMRLVRDGLTWADVETGVQEWRRRRGHGGGQ